MLLLLDEWDALLTLIDRFVSNGSHFAERQLMREEGQGVLVFKIVGIFSN